MLPYSFFKYYLEPQDSKLQNLRKKIKNFTPIMLGVSAGVAEADEFSNL